MLMARSDHSRRFSVSSLVGASEVDPTVSTPSGRDCLGVCCSEGSFS